MSSSACAFLTQREVEMRLRDVALGNYRNRVGCFRGLLFFKRVFSKPRAVCFSNSRNQTSSMGEAGLQGGRVQQQQAGTRAGTRAGIRAGTRCGSGAGP